MNLHRIILENIKKFLSEDEWRQMDLFDEPQPSHSSTTENTFQPTENWVREKYEYYNSQVWNNQLPPFNEIAFTFYDNQKSSLGYVKSGLSYFERDSLPYDWAVLHYGYREVYLTQLLLALSTRYDSSEEQYLATLVHEMCHIYESVVEPKYKLKAIITKHYSTDYPRHGHGKVFFEQARKLDAYGFDVQQVAKAEEYGGKIRNTARINNFYVYIFRYNGQYYFTKGSKKSVNSFIEYLNAYKNTSSAPNSQLLIYDYIGNSAEIDRYPVCKKPQLYYISNLQSTGLDKDLKFVKSIPLKYQDETVDTLQWCKEHVYEIADAVVSAYYKKQTKGGILSGVHMKMKKIFKIVADDRLVVEIDWWKNTTSTIFRVANGYDLHISLCDDSPLGDILDDNSSWGFHRAYNDEWGEIEEVLRNEIIQTIMDK